MEKLARPNSDQRDFDGDVVKFRPKNGQSYIFDKEGRCHLVTVDDNGFIENIVERAGRSIVTCQCPDCGTRWKRIEV